MGSKYKSESYYELEILKEKDISELYKLVASFEIINRSQKNKLYGVNYSYNKCTGRLIDNKIIEQLYIKDKLYWEFHLRSNKKEKIEVLDGSIKIYESKKEYNLGEYRYAVRYSQCVYRVEDTQGCTLYTSDDVAYVANWIVTKMILANMKSREKILKKNNMESELVFRLTPPYLNDIGLDMIIVIKSIPFKLLEIIKRLNVLLLNNGAEWIEYHINIASRKKISINTHYKNGACRQVSIGDSSVVIERDLLKKRKIKTYNNINTYVMSLESDGTCDKVKEKLKELVVMISSKNSKDVGRQLFLEKSYLEIEDMSLYGMVIVKMCEYSLLIQMDSCGMYIVSKVIDLSGVQVELFQVIKIYSTLELVKWLYNLKKTIVEKITNMYL